MGDNLDRENKLRSGLRRSFTRICTTLEGLVKTNADLDSIRAQLELLEVRFEELNKRNSIIYQLMLEDDKITDNILDTEMEKVDEYSIRYYKIKNIVIKLLDVSFDHIDSNSQASESDRTDVKHNESIYNRYSQLFGLDKPDVKVSDCSYKLPKLKFKEFSGEIKDWLPFWSQFKKIDSDTRIDPDEKVQYLVMATAPNSAARKVVESYPETGDMYPEIIKALKDRFGREDLLTEYYIRELLGIIFQNTFSSDKMPLALLYDKLQCHLRNLDTLGTTIESSGSILLPLVASSLPPDILKIWERNNAVSRRADKPDESKNRLESLLEFLRIEVEGDQKVNLATKSFDIPPIFQHKARKKDVKQQVFSRDDIPTATGLLTSVKDKGIGCIFCTLNHKSQDCIKAQNWSIKERQNILENKKACFSCLKVGHSIKYCKSKPRCIICKRAHFVIMCNNVPGQNRNESEGIRKSKDPVVQTDEALASLTSSCNVVLQTLQVTIRNNNFSRTARALIDTASQRSYILSSTAAEMGYSSKRKELIQHSLFGGTSTAAVQHKVVTVFLSSLDNAYKCNFEALDQTKICGTIVPIKEGPWIQELATQNVELSDVGKSGPIEILIGADIAGKLLTGNRKVLDSGLVALETRLGWTLIGKVPAEKQETSMAMTVLSMFVNDLRLSDLWTLDTLGISDPQEKRTKLEIEEEVKKHFLETVTVDEEERYIVHMPWVEGHPPLSDNYQLALHRLNSTIKKLNKEGLFDAYDQVFKDWIEEGIIEEVPASEINNFGHYLPHRPVIKENSSTRIRPVFDASAHENHSPSLNQCLETGLNLIEQIPAILLRFRMDRIGVASDIKKAFLQIKLHKSDKDFLRFLWKGINGELRIYRHCRVMFGVSCSPFLLGASIQHLLTTTALCHSLEFRDTTERLKKCFYVDNCLTSLPNVEMALKFEEQACCIMQQRKFELRAWEFTNHHENKVCNILGLFWNTGSDTLTVNIENLSFDIGRVTKRTILSVANRVFDPIGFTCPVTLYPKLLLQKTWQDKTGWEEEVDTETSQQFLKWLNDLVHLREVKVPRCFISNIESVLSLSLHTFCDASKLAYAAVVFLRVETMLGVEVKLVQAKARVAPLKKITIPRLELLAALIGARLYSTVVAEFDHVSQSIFWSDSTTVLAWIHREEKWGTFVSNRIKEIVKLSESGLWRHVPGCDNPADLPSRGCNGRALINSQWWEGPRWLLKSPQFWPAKEVQEDEDEIATERKRTVISSALSIVTDDGWYYRYFSRYNQIVRMVAWVRRFINNTRRTGVHREGDLVFIELEEAELLIIKLIQQKSFKGITDTTIVSLCPYLEDGIIRLKTKVTNREGDSKDFRNPILLPAHHPVVRRLVLYRHKEACHVGTQGLLCLLRERYWILGGRRTVRSVVKGCTICRRQEAKKIIPNSSVLPPSRVRDAAAFEVSGVDLAGPLYLKNEKKAWVCLYTCGVYRAVHLELLSSLSTDSFIQSLRRFISRRGRPAIIYSDNGSNFVGAENLFEEQDWSTIVKYSSAKRIEWRFNPPSAPWWGGWWERLIAVLKKLLRKVLGRATLDYEEMQTVLCDCESIINSRPITYMADTPSDLMPLTPSMFIQDIREVGVPDCDNIDAECLSKRVKYMQHLREDLRKRFRLEYLGRLQHTGKTKKTRTLAVGEVVLIENANTKRLNWPLGRIVEIRPSRDGVTRVVRLQTAGGQVLRPVQRIYPLELVTQSQEAGEEQERVEANVSEPDDNSYITKSGRRIKPLDKLDL